METITPSRRAIAAQYWMSKQDEDAAAALVRRAGEQLDDDHWMLVGGTKSLAGRLGRATEQRVFDTEYGGHSPEVMASEYGPYDDRSIHVVIVDAEGPVAAGRVVWSPTLDLPTKLETDLGFLDGRLREYHQFQDRYGTEQFSEKATAVVERRARATSVTGWLLGELRYQQMCLNEDAPYCAMLDVRFRRMLAQWGTDFEPALGLEPFEYLNQLCQPMFFYPSINPRFRESRIYRKLSVGWFDRVSRPLSEGSFLVDIRDSIEELTPSTI